MRLLGASSVAAMAFGVLPISPASAALLDICPAPGQTDRFTDDNGSTHEANINCAAAYQLVTGTTPTTYTPLGNLTRGQAATLLVNYVERSTGTTLATDATNDFSDTAGNVHATNIEKAADNNLLRGFNDGTYRPNAQITRAQFASIAVQATERVLGRALTMNATNEFDDDNGSVHETNIEKAVDNGILVGTGPRMFSPQANITRGQAASIIVGAAGNVLQPAGRFAPAMNNQSLAVSPTTATTLVWVDNPDTVATDDRTYTVTGLSATSMYRVTLVNGANVTTSATGQVSFVEDGTTGLALAGTVAADLTVVNGVVQAVDTQTVGGIVPVGGNITFTVDGEATESVVPVVYVDAGASTRLELNADNSGRPTEAFGVGGTITYVPAEAPFGSQGGNVTVATASAAGDFFTTATASFFFDANDVFQFQGVGITQAQFESVLSSGATLTVSYNPDPTGVSTFNVLTVPATTAVTAPTVTVVNADAGATANDVRVTAAPAATNAPGTTYVLQRAPVGVGADAVCNTGDDVAATTFTTVTTATQAAGTTAGTIVFTDNNVPNGCYAYRVTASAPITGAATPGAPSTTATVPAPADTTRPTMSFARLTTVGGLASTFDAGDVITVVMSEPVGTVSPGAIVRLQDGDGTVGDLVAGTNATFSTNTAATIVGGVSRPAGTVVTITLTGTPTGNAAVGTIAGLQVPGTIIDTAGLTDVAGNRVNLVGSDVIVEAGSIEGTLTPTTPPPTGGTGAPTASGTSPVAATDGTFANGDEFVITFNEALNPTGVNTSATTLTIADADGTTGTVRCAADCVLTVGNTVLTIPNGGFPVGSGGTAGFTGNLQVTATTGLVAADNGVAVAVPFTITAT